MKPSEKDQLRRALEQRRETLAAELKSDTARVRENVEDAAVLDLSRDDAELRDVEAARCLDCQRRHEKTYRR